MEQNSDILSILSHELLDGRTVSRSLVSLMHLLGAEKRRGEPRVGLPGLIELLKQKTDTAFLSGVDEKLLNSLGQTIAYLKKHLHDDAVELHRQLKVGHIPEPGLTEGLGLESIIIPAGFKTGFNPTPNYTELLKKYAELSNDQGLAAELPGKKEKLLQYIKRKKQEISQKLLFCAIKAFREIEAGVISSFGMNEIRDQLLHRENLLNQSAEKELEQVLLSPDNVEKFEPWFFRHGPNAKQPCRTMLNRYTERFLLLCLSLDDKIGLDLLQDIELSSCTKSDKLQAMFLLRFSEQGCNSPGEWQKFIKNYSDNRLMRKKAISELNKKPLLIFRILTDAKYLSSIPLPETSGSIDRSETACETFQKQYRRSFPEAFAGAEMAAGKTKEADLITKSEQKMETAPATIETSVSEPEKEDIAGHLLDAALSGFSPTEILMNTLGRKAAECDTILEEEEEETPDFQPQKQAEENLFTAHILPFISENPVPILAPLCIFIGLLILVFHLWEQAAWIRYGISPFLAVIAAFMLTKTGLWLKTRPLVSERPIFIMLTLSSIAAPASLFFPALLFTDKTISFYSRLFHGSILTILLSALWYILYRKIFTGNNNSVATEPDTRRKALLPVLSALSLPVFSLLDLLLATNKNIFFPAAFVITILSVWWLYRIKRQQANARLLTISIIGNCFLVGLFFHTLHGGFFTGYYGVLLISYALLFFAAHPLMPEEKGEICGKLHSLHYAGFFFILCGLLQEIASAEGRVAAMIAAGIILTLPAIDKQHERLSGLCIIFLMIAFFSLSSHPLFAVQWLAPAAILAALLLQNLRLSGKFQILSSAANQMTASFLFFTIIICIILQAWFHFDPFYNGIGFTGLALIAFRQGIITDKLIHIHAGITYACMGLFFCCCPEFSRINTNQQIGSFFSLAGLFWLIVATFSDNRTLRDSRSTGAWIIASLALCFFLISFPFNELGSSFSSSEQINILPAISCGLLLLFIALFSRSSVPFYTALPFFALAIPTIKAAMGFDYSTGMGAALVAIALIPLIKQADKFKWLKKERTGDLIFRQKPFPFYKAGAELITDPLKVGILLLCLTVILYRAPLALFRNTAGINTLFAVLIAAMGLQYSTLSFNKPSLSAFGHLISLLVFVSAFYISKLPTLYFPLFIFTALIYVTGTGILIIKKAPPEKILLFQTPLYKIGNWFCWTVAVFTLYTYLIFPDYNFYCWLPVGLFFTIYALMSAVYRQQKWFFHVSALILWQSTILFILQTTAYNLNWKNLPHFFSMDSVFYPGTISFGLLVMLFFHWLKHRQTINLSYYKNFTILPVLMNTICLSAVIIHPFQLSPLLLSTLAVNLFLIGLFYNWAFFFPAAVLPLYFAAIKITGQAGTAEITQPYSLTRLFNPCGLFGISLFYALYARLLAKYLPEKEYKIKPSLLSGFGASSGIIAFFFCFFGNLNTEYHSFPILSLYLFSLPALIAAPVLSFSGFHLSRHFCVGLTVIAASIGLFFHYAPQLAIYLPEPHPTHLIALGLLLSLIISSLITKIFPVSEKKDYLGLQYICAISTMVFTIIRYFGSRVIGDIVWQKLIFSALLCAGAAFYLRWGIADNKKEQRYGLYAMGISCAIFCTVLFLFSHVLQLQLTPPIVFAALFLAPLWFFIRAEIRIHQGRDASCSEAVSVGLFLLLCLFYFYGNLMEFFFLPDSISGFTHYHQNAPLALIAAFILLRINSHKGRLIPVYFGLCTGLGAFYFMFGLYPPLSPENSVFNAFLLLFGLAALLMHNLKPHRFVEKFLLKYTGINEKERADCRHFLFIASLFTAHASFFHVLATHKLTIKSSAAAFALSILWYYTARRFSRAELLYPFLFLVLFSLWPLSVFIGHHAAYPMLNSGLFLVIIGLFHLHRKKRLHWEGPQLCIMLGITVALIITRCVMIPHEFHIWYYATLPLLSIGLLFIPARLISPGRAGINFVSHIIVYSPGIALFLMAPLLLSGSDNTLLKYFTWPSVPFAAFLICLFILFFEQAVKDWERKPMPEEPLLWHHLLDFLYAPGYNFYIGSLFTISLFALLQTNLWLRNPELITNKGLLFVMVFTLPLLFLHFAKAAQSRFAMILSEICALHALIILRCTIPQLLNIPWGPEADLYLSFFIALAINMAKPLLQESVSAIRQPAEFTLFCLPLTAAAIYWYYDVDFETLSRVLLLYSALFTWKSVSGKERFTFAYALCGFNVWFFLILSSGQINSPQAFITPVCLSVLVLVQLFRDRTSPQTANIVRSLMLIILFAVSAFETLTHASALRHLFLILLSFTLIGSGAILKVKVMVVGGFLFFMTDIATIFFLILKAQQTETLKILIGLSLSVGGGILLLLYVLYQKHREPIDSFIDEKMRFFQSFE